MFASLNWKFGSRHKIHISSYLAFIFGHVPHVLLTLRILLYFGYHVSIALLTH